MKQKSGGIKRLMEFTGKHRGLLTVSRILSGLSSVFILGPFLCVYFAARDLVGVFAGTPLDTNSLVRWGLLALGLELIGLLLYFSALLCSHVVAFHTEKNLKMAALKHLAKMPMGYFDANPSGKLAESWPYRYEDVPSSELYGKTADALYQEGLYVGYRYYDKAGVPVRWSFGYGLSYTKFTYSNLTLSGDTVFVTVKNTGSIAGAEVVQLYVEAPQNSLHRPVRELKGFQKLFLQPNESREAVFRLTDRSFAVWQDGWKIPVGQYTVSIGGLTAPVIKHGETLPVPAWQRGSWYQSCTGKPNKKDWEAMLGREYIPPVLKKGAFTMDNTVMEMKGYSLIMKIMYKAVEATIAKGFGGKKDYKNPEFRMMMNASAGAPLRSMQISGGIKGGVLPGMLELANGHILRGLWRMLRG